jgi:hypothetical protein
LQYTYSATQNNGQITQAVDTLSGETISYHYDALKRLTLLSAAVPDARAALRKVVQDRQRVIGMVGDQARAPDKTGIGAVGVTPTTTWMSTIGERSAAVTWFPLTSVRVVSGIGCGGNTAAPFWSYIEKVTPVMLPRKSRFSEIRNRYPAGMFA